MEQAGCDPQQLCKDGHQPMYYAKQSGSLACAQLLADASHAANFSSTHVLSEGNDVDKVANSTCQEYDSNSRGNPPLLIHEGSVACTVNDLASHYDAQDESISREPELSG